MSGTRTYELYPVGSRFSNQSRDYHGTYYIVVATSLRQASACAYQDQWVNPRARTPVGILYTYRRDVGRRLWCGCRGHQVVVKLLPTKHNARVSSIREAIATHQCPLGRDAA